MQTGRAIHVAVAGAALSPGLLGAAPLHVSPNGDDAAPGTRQRPFATFERAQRAVRTLKSTPAGMALRRRFSMFSVTGFYLSYRCT